MTCPLNGIVDFNNTRQLTEFNGEAEYNMLTEELQEFLVACSDEDEHEQVDALCDLIVVATGAIHKLGYDPRSALQETVKEISSRKGSLNEDSGKWEKDLNQNPDTLYEADYTNAKELVN